MPVLARRVRRAGVHRWLAEQSLRAVALTVFATGLWVDFLEGHLPVLEGQRRRQAGSTGGCLTGWRQVPGPAGLRGRDSSGSEPIVARGYQRTFDDGAPPRPRRASSCCPCCRRRSSPGHRRPAARWRTHGGAVPGTSPGSGRAPCLLLTSACHGSSSLPVPARPASSAVPPRPRETTPWAMNAPPFTAGVSTLVGERRAGLRRRTARHGSVREPRALCGGARRQGLRRGLSTTARSGWSTPTPARPAR